MAGHHHPSDAVAIVQVPRGAVEAAATEAAAAPAATTAPAAPVAKPGAKK